MKNAFSNDPRRTRRRILPNRSGERFHTPCDPTCRFCIVAQRRRASAESQIRIECIARSSTRALRDRRLNSLYRRIIANENIGRAGITNGRSADEMHDRATFPTYFVGKKYSLDGRFFFYRASKPALSLSLSCYRQYEQSTIYLHVIVCPLR